MKSLKTTFKNYNAVLLNLSPEEIEGINMDEELELSISEFQDGILQISPAHSKDSFEDDTLYFMDDEETIYSVKQMVRTGIRDSHPFIDPSDYAEKSNSY